MLLVAGSWTSIHFVAAEGVNLLPMKLCVGSGCVIFACVVGHGRIVDEWLSRDVECGGALASNGRGTRPVARENAMVIGERETSCYPSWNGAMRTSLQRRRRRSLRSKTMVKSSTSRL